VNATAVQSQPDLLAYALFDLDPRARCLRQPLLVFLVSLALFERGSPADREELLVACKEQFLSGDEIDRAQIDRVVAASTTAGLLVDVGEGTVDLSEERREQLTEAAGRIAAQREAFHRAIRDAVQSQLGEAISGDEVERLEAALDDFIQRLFLEQSVALAQIFGPEGNGFDDSTAGHLTFKSLDTLARAVVPASSDKLVRAQVAQGIRTGLLGLAAEGQKYLAAVYQRTVAFALLQQDPKVRKIKRELARARLFYLDTNVVMALLFPAHTQHERVLSAVNAARDIGCKIVVSTFTAEELEQQLRESNENYRKLESRTGAFPIVNDDILRSFALQQKGSPGLRWRAYYAKYYPPEDALGDFGIEVRKDEVAEAHHDSRRPAVRNAVQSIKPMKTHHKVIDYDTDNLILIQRRRKHVPADVMGSRVWLITLDTMLKGVERRLLENRVYSVPSAKRIGAWVADLSPHLSPDDADLGEYALHLVQSQLDLLAEDPVFADVNFLTTLEESPFDVKELLAGGPEMSRRILVALQEEQEIQAVLGERPEDEADYGEWAERFAEAVKAVLRKLDRSSETEEAAAVAWRERDRALRREAQAKRERDLVRRRIADLERELTRREGGESRMRRLTRWLRRRL
jgi:hypothetical protein